MQRGRGLEQGVEQRRRVSRLEDALQRAHRLPLRQSEPFRRDALQLGDRARGGAGLRARQRLQRLPQEGQLLRHLRRIYARRKLEPRGILQQGSEQRRTKVEKSGLPSARTRGVAYRGAPGGKRIVATRRYGCREPLVGPGLDPSSHPTPCPKPRHAEPTERSDERSVGRLPCVQALPDRGRSGARRGLRICRRA